MNKAISSKSINTEIKQLQLILHNGSLQRWELLQVNGWHAKHPFLGEIIYSTQRAVNFSVSAMDLLTLENMYCYLQ